MSARSGSTTSSKGSQTSQASQASKASKGSKPSKTSKTSKHSKTSTIHEEDEDDEMDEEEFRRQALKAQGRAARSSVSAERWTKSDDWKPPVHPKTDEQRAQIKAAVSKSFMFAALDPKQLEQVLDAIAGPHTIATGSEVIKQGAVVDSGEPGLFILQDGTLDVYKAGAGDAHPGKKVFTFNKTGQSFGELALLYNCPRAATIVATSDSVLWSVDRDTFNNLVKGASQEMRTRQENFLGSVELLKNLTPDERSKIADVLQPRHCEAGEHIVRQGEEGSEFYIIEEGSAYAAVGGKRVKEYNVGEYFGELALLKRQVRAADVVANASPTKLMVLDGDSFTRLLGSLNDLLEERAKSYASVGGSAPADDEEEGEDDEMDDEEFLRQQAKAKRGARSSISAERWTKSDDWKPPVHQKTSEQREKIKQSVSKSFIFASLNENQLEQVIDAFEGPHVKKTREEVIRQGAIVDSGEPALFLLEKGTLDVYKASPDDAHPGKQVFTYTKAGQSFGELALLYNCPRAATVIATSDSVLWSIDRDTFNNLVKGATQEMRSRHEQFLESVEILKSLTTDERSKIADVLQPLQCEKGERIIRQGEEGTEFYIIEEGGAFAAVNGSRVKEYKVGDYFGELALIKRSTRAADVVANASPTKLMMLDGDSFSRLLGSLGDLMEERAKDYQSAQIAPTTEPQSDEVEEDEDDEMDEEEFLRQQELMKAKQKQGGARGSIIAESWTKSDDWKPPVYKKTPAQREQVKAALSKSFMFAALSPPQLEQLLDAIQGPHKKKKKQEVIKQGAVVDSTEPGLFILEKGSLDVYKAGPGDKHPGKKVFTYNKAGQSFGELALLYNCPRAATVIAAADSIVWSIDRDTFNNLVKGASQELRSRQEEFLSSVEILKHLTDDERSKMADCLSTRQYEKGEKIIQQGEEGIDFFILESGAACAAVNGKRVKDYKVGDYFGELALLNKQARAADVIAEVSPTSVMTLDCDSFTRLLGSLNDILAERAKEYNAPRAGGQDRVSVADLPLPDSAVAGSPLPPDEAIEDPDDDDDVLDDEQFEAHMRQAARSSISPVARQGISAEQTLGQGKNWKPTVNAKTALQRSRLREWIQESFVFSTLPEENLEQLLDAFRGPDTITPGSEVIREGANVLPGEPGIFFLETGGLDVFKAAENLGHPGEKIHSYDAAGQSFGELALLYNCPRAATVIARSESQVWWLDRDTFNYLVKGSAQAARSKQLTFLASIDLLKNLSAEERGKLLDVIEVRMFRKGEQIIREGETGSEFMLLHIGFAYASVGGQRLKEYGPGSYFGELALLNSEPRAASVFADATPTGVMALDGASFRRLLGGLNSDLTKRAKDYARKSAVELGISAGPEGEDEDEDDLEEILQVEEMERIRSWYGKKGPRKPIRSERWLPNPNWKPPVYPKTTQQEKNVRGAISRSFMFNSLTPELLKNVVDSFQGPHHVKRNAQVIRQGNFVNSGEPGLYILERGSLDVFVAQDGQPYPGTKVSVYDKPGDSFGKSALLYNCPRAATVLAKTDSVLWSIDRDTFNFCVKGSSQAGGQRIRQFIDSVHILRGLRPQEREKLADVMYVREYTKGDRIIEKGQLGDEFFIIENGSAFASDKGKRVKEYGPTDYFGELALLRQQPRSVDVYADVSPTRVLVIDGDTFRRLLGPLQGLLADRAQEYGVITFAPDSSLSSTQEKQIQVASNGSWCCNKRNCNFWNFAHTVRCLKCGQERQHDPKSLPIAKIPSGSLTPPMTGTPLPPTPMPEVTCHSLEIVLESSVHGNVAVRYERRTAEAGVVQGVHPLAPGERFQAIVRSLGTFGEIGIGLAPVVAWRPSKDGAPPLGKTPSRLPPPQSMIGWSTNEVGLHGDHGLWYMKGRCPGVQVSKPWECGDVLECGLTQDGRVYAARNGCRVAESTERWPMEHAFPTATLKSLGAEVAINLRDIEVKYAFGAQAGQPATPAAMLKQLQATDVGQDNAKRSHDGPQFGIGSLQRWLGLWCGCQDIEKAGAS